MKTKTTFDEQLRTAMQERAAGVANLSDNFANKLVARMNQKHALRRRRFWVSISSVAAACIAVTFLLMPAKNETKTLGKNMAKTEIKKETPSIPITQNTQKKPAKINTTASPKTPITPNNQIIPTKEKIQKKSKTTIKSAKIESNTENALPEMPAEVKNLAATETPEPERKKQTETTRKAKLFEAEMEALRARSFRNIDRMTNRAIAVVLTSDVAS